MSRCLILVKYSLEDTQICEDNSKNIDSIDISDEMINDLELSKVIDRICVFEESGGVSYETEVIANPSIRDIIKKCEELAVIYCSEIHKGVVNDKDRNDTFEKLTVLLNIRRILRKKQIKFKNDDSVYIVWG
ncbi:hypothetical protein [Anaerosporobacter sp.]|uniref:hypothetical protein n=1 Tax=Anaerosporobacter sp. TaxID=1872529 RepID=UPI00286EC0CB|nr:hypothetical protein [Anaerosporobacter sp.]